MVFKYFFGGLAGWVAGVAGEISTQVVVEVEVGVELGKIHTEDCQRTLLAPQNDFEA